MIIIIKFLDWVNILLLCPKVRGRGKIIIISISKIIKIIEILKNRKEKGVRVIIEGSNPHSKGVVFSLSMKVFFSENK